MVDSAMDICIFTISRCNEVLMLWNQADDDDNQPQDKDSWRRWFDARKDGISRREAVRELVGRVSICQQTLHLALVAVNTRLSETSRLPRAPFYYLREAAEQAQSVLQDMEMGRLEGRPLVIGAGVIHSLKLASCRSAAKVGGGVAHMDWERLGLCQVVVLQVDTGESTRAVTRVGSGGGFALDFVVQDDDDEPSVGERRRERLRLDDVGVRFDRRWLNQVPDPFVRGEDDDADGLCYLLGHPEGPPGPLFLLQFDSVGHISAECFEVLLCMLKAMSGPGGPSASPRRLYEAVDLDALQGSAWPAFMATQGLPLLEALREPSVDPLAGRLLLSSEGSGDAAAAGLVTPARAGAAAAVARYGTPAQAAAEEDFAALEKLHLQD